MIGSVVVDPPDPPRRNAPQYRPAHSTVDPSGAETWAAEELKVDGSVSASRLTIEKPLLLARAPVALPSLAAAQRLSAATEQVSRLLPTNVITPLSLAANRGAKGVITSAATGVIRANALAATAHRSTVTAANDLRVTGGPPPGQCCTRVV